MNKLTEFLDYLESIIRNAEDARDMHDGALSAIEAFREKNKPETKQKCECHERDSSYVCDYCYSQGLRGHMQT